MSHTSVPSAWAVLVLAAVVGCAPQGEQKIWTAEDTPLIDRELLFGNPERTSLRLSPDGERMAYLAPVDGVLNVWVAPAADIEAAAPVTNDTERGIRTFFWAYTNEHIVYAQDQQGDENWRIYVTDVASKETRDLTPLDDVQARVQAVSHRQPQEILIALNDRNPQLHDVYSVQLITGERKLVEQNDQGFIGYVTDDDFRVRVAMKPTQAGGAELHRKQLDGDWKKFVDVPQADMLTTQPIGFDTAGETLYMVDSRNRDTAALVTVDLQSGESAVLYASDKADVSDVMAHPETGKVQAAAYQHTRTEWVPIDDGVRGDLEYLARLTDGDPEVVSRTLDDERWIVAYEMDNGPIRYYRYDRGRQKAEFLLSSRPALEDVPLAHMHPTVIEARDGMDLVSYYTLPVWTDNDGNGRPERALPTVLFVHGGPWARDQWGYDPYHQWMANRGYAVLSVNFRGSTGFGKGFVNAGDKEWGRRMHDDLLDAVAWAVDQGIADENRVAIMGGSYGGYATLAGLTFTPDTFACGVDIVGPSNLVTLLNAIPPYWAPLIDMFTARVGDHRTEAGRTLLEERSPLNYVDRIERPLLIAQGANDPRVKQVESDQIVSKMQVKDIPVTYVLFPDEGHGFARPANRLAFNAVAEAFLAQHLGGRVQPVGDDFEGSSISVPEGQELVPGVAEQLAEPKAVAAAG